MKILFKPERIFEMLEWQSASRGRNGINKMKSIFEKFRRLFELFWTLLTDKRERAFVRHNRRHWRSFKAFESREEQVLVEVYPIASSILAQSYLANALAQVNQAKIVAFDPYFGGWVRGIYNWRNRRLYSSFGARKFFGLSLNSAERAEAEKITADLLLRMKTKEDVEKLEVEGIWIGDLLYDSHLMRNVVPTIDFDDPKFAASTLAAVSYYVFWRNYLDRFKVKAAIVSHCVYYENAVIVRLCVARGIPCYQVNATSLYYVDKKHIRAYNDYLYLPREFSLLPAEEQMTGLALAKERLELRFKGEVGVDMFYSTKSAYANDSGERVLRPSEKVKILIATHCFFDSPHPYGNNLFTDFYEWLTFLGELSNRTDYDWYIKTHPDVLPGNAPVIAELVKKYPKFTLLPQTVSHLQIIRDGVNVVLTVFGTIAVEYAALGLNVINASKSNPHAAYDFNLHIDDKAEYERILLDLKNLKIQIDPAKVYEHYYMYYLNRPENWLFKDYKKFVEEIGGYNAQIGPITYEAFLKEFSPLRHEQTNKLMTQFIESKEYVLFNRQVKIAFNG